MQFDCAPESLCGMRGGGCVGAMENRRELLAAIPGDDVTITRQRLQCLAECDEYLIAALMAVRIVVALEVVHVEQQQ